MRDRVIVRDDTALTEIYDQYASFVYGLALRVIGDVRAAEDVSQDVFVGIWQRPEAFDPRRGSLRTWLGTLTHRRAVDYVRREEARRRRAEREASRAVTTPDVEEMATALVAAERVRCGARRVARGAAARHPARVLRRQDVSPGRRGVGHPRGHGQVPTPTRPPPCRRRTRSRRSRVVTPRPELTPDDVAELLGAYALDACSPEETAAIEAVLAEHPDLADEAMRLTRAASWIGATETLVPPASLRDRVYVFALMQRTPDRALDTYMSLSGKLAEVIDELPEAALDETTANGLTGHDLVVHMAAQESLLAQEAGAPSLPDLQETDIDARTAALLPSFDGQPVRAASDLWQHAVESNRAWATGNVGGTVTWRGIPMTRDDAIVIRAFETWIHTDDLRRVAGWDLMAPAPDGAGGDVGARVAHPAGRAVVARRGAPGEDCTPRAHR